MIYYNPNNKIHSRNLCNNQTDAERLLWSRIRRKQINNIQFYRQRPIGNFIVDFFAPLARLIVEVDGGQHFEEVNMDHDKKRDFYFQKLNYKVLRFDNFQVLQSLENVLEVIFHETENPSHSPFKKGVVA